MLLFAKPTRKIWYGYYKMWNPWATMVFIQRIVMWLTDVFAMPLTLTSIFFIIIILLSTFLWLFFLFRNMTQYNITHDLEYVLSYSSHISASFCSFPWEIQAEQWMKYFSITKIPSFFSTQVSLGTLRQCSLSSKD